MDDQPEKEKAIIKIVTEQFKKDGGHNGIPMNSFDHILDLNIEDRNQFLFRMQKEKKLLIFQSLNSLRITLPK